MTVKDLAQMCMDNGLVAQKCVHRVSLLFHMI